MKERIMPKGGQREMGKRESIRERKTKKKMRREEKRRKWIKRKRTKNGSERITIKKKGSESKMIKGWRGWKVAKKEKEKWWIRTSR